jgi:hypothetical protein
LVVDANVERVSLDESKSGMPLSCTIDHLTAQIDADAGSRTQCRQKVTEAASDLENAQSGSHEVPIDFGQSLVIGASPSFPCVLQCRDTIPVRGALGSMTRVRQISRRAILIAGIVSRQIGRHRAEGHELCSATHVNCAIST